jgi:hypothetical protein
MKKTLATLFIIVLIVGASLSVVSMAMASEEEELEVNSEVETEDEEEMGETEHALEEEDDEEASEIIPEEDDEGDLHILSDDNTVRFKHEEPRVRFIYNTTEENTIEFEADDFALIEFVDVNNDSRVQSEEIKRKLEFNQIQWNFTYEKMVKANSTIITVTYYANTTEYEIALIMRVYQKRMTESSTTGNTTLVFDVDGGADEVKFDLIVNRWTWVDESSKLALFMELESEVEGEVVLESANMNKDQIAIKLDSIKIEIGWVKQAKVVAADGSEELVNVTVDYKSLDIELEESEVELELDVYFIYPYFGENKLIHDPSIGIEDDLLLYIFTLLTPEVLLGTAVTAVAIVVVASTLTRRRKGIPSVGSPASLALRHYVYRELIHGGRKVLVVA